jgi:hypothetical protein
MAEGLELGREAGLGAGAEQRGQPVQSGPPTPSAVGCREEVAGPVKVLIEKTASTGGAVCSGPEQTTLGSRPEQTPAGSGPEPPRSKTRQRSAAARQTRRKRAAFDEADQDLRDWMIYHQVVAESRSQRSVAKTFGLSPARVSQVLREMKRRVANNPEVFEFTERDNYRRQAEADYLIRSEEDLAFVTQKMRAAAKPLVTQKVGSRGEVTHEETITREQKSEQLYWYRERRKVAAEIRDHSARQVPSPPPDAHLSPWHPWDCEAEAHAANWIQLVFQGILSRGDYDIWCERHSHWCQLTYPSFNDMVLKVAERVPRMLWGLTPEKAMRMGAKVPGLERFADLAKAWVRDGGQLRDDWETPPSPDDDVSPLPTWTLRTVDVTGTGSFAVCDAEEVARFEAARAEKGQVEALKEKVAPTSGLEQTESPFQGGKYYSQAEESPAHEVNIAFNDERRQLREAWDCLLEDQLVTPEEYADYLARDARKYGASLPPAASAEGPKALSGSAPNRPEIVSEEAALPGGSLASGSVARGLDSGTEVGEGCGQPTPSAVGRREEVDAPDEVLDKKATSTRGADCSGPGQSTLRRRDRPPRNRREQLFAERQERIRQRRRQEDEAHRAANERRKAESQRSRTEIERQAVGERKVSRPDELRTQEEEDDGGSE